MRNQLIYQQITRQRWINGKLYEFAHYSEPVIKGYAYGSPYAEITVRRWNGYRWEAVHRFN